MIKLQIHSLCQKIFSEPYAEFDSNEENAHNKPLKVDIDLGLTAYANARK